MASPCALPPSRHVDWPPTQARGTVRAIARRYGQDIFGARHPRHWGVSELVEQGGLEGIAPWGSPNRDPNAEPWLGLDPLRGISDAPEGPDLWHIWRETAARLEEANRRDGVSPAGEAYRSV
jgi:hypothetical protein